MTSREKIVRYTLAAKRPFTSRGMAKALKMPVGTVNAVMAYMKKDNLLYHRGGVRWIVTPFIKDLTVERVVGMIRARQMEKPTITKIAARTVQPQDMHGYPKANVVMGPLPTGVQDMLALMEDGQKYRRIKPLLQELFAKVE